MLLCEGRVLNIKNAVELFNFLQENSSVFRKSYFKWNIPFENDLISFTPIVLIWNKIGNENEQILKRIITPLRTLEAEYWLISQYLMKTVGSIKNATRIYNRGRGRFCSYFKGKQHPNLHWLLSSGWAVWYSRWPWAGFEKKSSNYMTIPKWYVGKSAN